MTPLPQSSEAPVLPHSSEAAVLRFYLTGRQPLRPGAILLAIVVAVVALSSVLWGLSHTGHVGIARDKGGASRSPDGSPAGSPKDDEDDDPNQIDTIVLGDPADAPVPAKKGDHVSPVHATILVKLPRFGEQVGLIPDSPAGRLLYEWLAAFNKPNEAAMVVVLPNEAVDETTAAQMELRHRTGGFNLLSAKEAQPGVLVFRLRDQTKEANESLGTLQVAAGSSPAAIGSFSLRVVERLAKKAEGGAGSADPPR